MRSRKLFVAVVVFAIASTAFADDIEWQIAPPASLIPGGGMQEGGETPKIQVSQDTKEENTSEENQQSTIVVTPFGADDHAPGNQKPGQYSKGKINPDKKPSEWSTVAIVGTIIGVVGLVLTWRQVSYAKRAHIREEKAIAKATESAVIDQKKERAYLTVNHWRLTNEYKGGPYTLTCDLINTGRTPATLGEYDMHTDIRTDLPPLLGYEHLPKTDLKHISLGAREHRQVQAPDPVRQFARQVVEGFLDLITLSPRRKEEIVSAAMASTPMPPELLDQILGNDRVTLYVYGCIAYDDTFGEPHKFAFCVRYDPRQDIFIVVNDRKYNYSM